MRTESERAQRGGTVKRRGGNRYSEGPKREPYGSRRDKGVTSGSGDAQHSPRQLCRTVAWTVVGACAALVLSACAADGGPPSTPAAAIETPNPYYAAELATAKGQATTDFERRILDDDVITRAEFLEAKALYYRCLRSYGLVVTPNDPQSDLGGFSVGGTWDESVVNTVLAECPAGTIDVIEPLYASMVKNPQKRDLNDLLAECLVAVGVVEPPFTGKDYARGSQGSEFNLRVMDDPDGAKCEETLNYHSMAGAP